MAQFVANPRVSFSIVEGDTLAGLAPQRVLLVGQKTSSGTAIAGLSVDVPRDNASINLKFGADAHLAMIARAYRSVNQVTNLDAIVLADNGGGTAATSNIAFSGTATASASLYITVASAENHKYQVDVLSGDTAAGVVTKILALVTADRYVPFTAAGSSGTVTFTAANKGLHANDWLLSCFGYVPGLTYTLTGWASGATNPSLTSVFDPIQTIRYQTILWPASYDITPLKTLLEARKNVSNMVMDGMGFQFQNVAFGTITTAASTINSSEIVLMTNEPNSNTHWIGPHLPEAPDALTAKVTAALDLRLEPGASCSSVVVSNAANDQYGGIHMNSLPAFNTPLLNVGLPQRGTGYTDIENVELAAAGVSVLGVNRDWNEVITGTMVTTYLNDPAGNADTTWQFLEWRRTHGAIREFFQVNCQKNYRQMRLTTGTAVSGYSMVDQPSIVAFLRLLYIQLTRVALTVDGLDARTTFESNLVVTLIPETRTVSVAMNKVPMVSQLGVINGTIKYTFQTS